MVDPIPEGYISLVEAYKAYEKTWPGAARYEDLCEPFIARTLEALVQAPGASEKMRLHSWDKQYFPERAFMDQTLPEWRDEPWSALGGRTPFVNEEKFLAWLEAHCAKERERVARPAAVSSSEYAVESVKAHLEEAARAYRSEKGPQLTRDGSWKTARAESGAFPGVSSTVWREAWATANLPSAWRVRGRGRK
jgi:hypothetical protein